MSHRDFLILGPGPTSIWDCLDCFIGRAITDPDRLGNENNTADGQRDLESSVQSSILMYLRILGGEARTTMFRAVHSKTTLKSQQKGESRRKERVSVDDDRSVGARCGRGGKPVPVPCTMTIGGR